MSEISTEANAQYLEMKEDGTFKKIHFETNIQQVKGKATTIDAITGSNNTKYMTPLTVKDSIEHLGVKTSVFDGRLRNSNDGYIDEKLIIPLGKVPKQYIKLTGGGYYDSIGICFVDIEKSKAYIYETHTKNKGGSKKVIYNLGERKNNIIYFLGINAYGNSKFNSIKVINDSLYLGYSVYDEVEISNLLVEVV